MRDFAVEEALQGKLSKIQKRDKALYSLILKKFQQILETEGLDHFKNLKSPQQRFKRVHIGPFVLIFQASKEKIKFFDIDHHDNIYK